jgi:hypothetical protein
MQLIDETIEDFTSLIEADFGPLDRRGEFEGCLLDWLHFRARILPRTARDILSSPLVEGHQPNFRAIAKIALELRLGGDLRPWLGSSVMATKRRSHEADMLFNDWSITHFHLGGVFTPSNLVRRTKPVLFAYVSNQRAVLLDVLPHGRGVHPPWALQHLLETMLQTCPEEMERFEIKGVYGPRRPTWSDHDVRQLREVGLSSPVSIAGRVFMPGLGIASSGHATRIVRYWNYVRRSIDQLKRNVLENSLPYPAQRVLQSQIGVPVRLGVRLVSDHLVLTDKNRRIDLMSFVPVC